VRVLVYGWKGGGQIRVLTKRGTSIRFHPVAEETATYPKVRSPDDSFQLGVSSSPVTGTNGWTDDRT
jgi:hypothetical protein